MERIERVRVVLVSPKSGRNVGAVCRAMKTMGLVHLSIIGGNGLDLSAARTLAVHAADILENADFAESLAEALKNASLVAGFTRRRGKRRKYFAMSPEALARRIAQNERGRFCLVFGAEESGLTDEELALCNVAVRIPTSPLCPSLNLSHAVQIVSYEIYRTLRQSSAEAPKGFQPIGREKLDRLVAVSVESLKNVGFFSRADPLDMRVFLRDILARVQLSGAEGQRGEALFRKISGLIAHRGVQM